MGSKVVVSGWKELCANLRDASLEVSPKVVKPALKKCAKTVVKVVKAAAPVSTGMLKASIKPKVYKTRDDELRAMIYVGKGAKSARKAAQKRLLKKGGSASKGRRLSTASPSKYAHLQEFGTRYAAAQPFMIQQAKAAWRQNHEVELKKHMVALTNKLRAKGKHL